MCIDKSLPTEQRRQVHGEILCALQEVGLLENIKWMIGVMTPPIWRSAFIRVGWPIEFLGDPLQINDKERISVGRMNISLEILMSIRQQFLITGSVLECPQQKISSKRAA